MEEGFRLPEESTVKENEEAAKERRGSGASLANMLGQAVSIVVYFPAGNFRPLFFCDSITLTLRIYILPQTVQKVIFIQKDIINSCYARLQVRTNRTI